jgi:hypothetical protein
MDLTDFPVIPFIPFLSAIQPKAEELKAESL